MGELLASDVATVGCYAVKSKYRDAVDVAVNPLVVPERRWSNSAQGLLEFRRAALKLQTKFGMSALEVYRQPVLLLDGAFAVALGAAMDAALAGRGNVLQLLPRDLRNETLSGKLEGQMSGLIGPYARQGVARYRDGQPEAASAGSSGCRPPVETHSRVPTHPCPCGAWEAQRSTRSGLRPRWRPAGRFPIVVAAGSLLDRVATSLSSDSVWTQWDSGTVIAAQDALPIRGPRPEAPINVSTNGIQTPAESPDWLISLVADEKNGGSVKTSRSISGNPRGRSDCRAAGAAGGRSGSRSQELQGRQQAHGDR
ncbi:hypothetical protein [Bradyrhizobium yuanmingense]|uniref:hypothetical protein n=1 Tax=Bradyrhizobium yuanmingense TaxID=108015 RepID=UPI0023B9F01B|nr:hypothetical protein [Bradyrhizobium yuanmingense]MDF0584168.1 hypothetical protein [Bradyrhizobium yuanmingense]